MGPTDVFPNKMASHEHSLRVLELLSLYDDFMDSLTVIADMGCGSGLDIEWWALSESRDDPPIPHNYTCYAVDRDISKLDSGMPENVIPIQGDFQTPLVPRKIDLLWSHDSFQYATDPLGTLKVWNESMSDSGMLVLILPQTSGHQYNRHSNRVHSGSYFNHNVCNLMYMMAVNGFDCKDAYFYKMPNDPWVHAIAYKSEFAPMDPATTTWYDLVEKDLVNQSVKDSINKYGYLRQEDMICQWIDRENYFVQD